MNTKRIMRWVIVLFLLAALPVMTAVMAQGQEPAAPQASAAWNVYESEPNDTLATADAINVGDVVGGDAECYEDECYFDYYRFQMTGGGYVVIQTRSSGSYGGPFVGIYDSTGAFLAGYEDSAGAPLLYTLGPGAYYIGVHGGFPDESSFPAPTNCAWRDRCWSARRRAVWEPARWPASSSAPRTFSPMPT